MLDVGLQKKRGLFVDRKLFKSTVKEQSYAYTQEI